MAIAGFGKASGITAVSSRLDVNYLALRILCFVKDRLNRMSLDPCIVTKQRKIIKIGQILWMLIEDNIERNITLSFLLAFGIFIFCFFPIPIFFEFLKMLYPGLAPQPNNEILALCAPGSHMEADSCPSCSISLAAPSLLVAWESSEG